MEVLTSIPQMKMLPEDNMEEFEEIINEATEELFQESKLFIGPIGLGALSNVNY